MMTTICIMNFLKDSNLKSCGINNFHITELGNFSGLLNFETALLATLIFFINFAVKFEILGRDNLKLHTVNVSKIQNSKIFIL